MNARDLGAILLMYDENVRYVPSTLTPGWNRLKPGLRYALLCGDDDPFRTKLEWADAITPMMKARAFKNQDERECMRIVGAISEAGNWEFMKFLTPVLTENQLTAHIMEFLYNIPGKEDIELSRVGGQP